MSYKTKGERLRIGARLRAARERARISYADVAEAVEVQPLAVERWERGSALPSLIEFRGLMELYGIMACEILFERNPYELSPDEAGELTRAAKEFSPGLRSKVDLLLAMLARGKEPEWRAGLPPGSIYDTLARPNGSSNGDRTH